MTLSERLWEMQLDIRWVNNSVSIIGPDAIRESPEAQELLGQLRREYTGNPKPACVLRFAFGSTRDGGLRPSPY